MTSLASTSLTAPRPAPDEPADLVRRVEAARVTIAAHADRAEQSGRLADEVVAAMHEAGLYRMLVPRRWGGSGLPVLESFPVIEAMARIDGATGWNLNVAATSMLLVTRLVADPTVLDEILGDPRALIAGGVDPAGVSVERVPGGCVFDGVLRFASGGSEATWVLAGGAARAGRDALVGPDGAPVLLAGLLPRDAARQLDTWRVSGLRGTGSDDLALDRLFVPEERVFAVPLGPAAPDGAGGVPTMSLLGAGLTFVAIGIAAHALELATAVAVERRGFGSSHALAEQADVQADLARATAGIGAARSYVTASWQELETCTRAGVRPSPRDVAALRLSYVTATQLAAEATDLASRAAGSAALFSATGIERCWRDVHAVTRHVAVSSRLLARIGQVLLGSDPGPGLI